MNSFLQNMVVGAKIFFILSCGVFVMSLIYAGFYVADKSDECETKGGVLVKTNVKGYVCLDKDALK